MELLRKCLSDWNIDITDLQLGQFEKYCDLLLSWNEKINITAISDKEDIIVKHFADSLAILRYTDPSGKRMIDVGTGGGFPGIPVSIMCPNCEVLLLDSLKKRISFLEEVISNLGLKKVTCMHGRAENIANLSDKRESFDLAVSRAVANLSTLSEYCLPFVNINGLFISYKSGNIESEFADSENAIHILGGSCEKIERFRLPVCEHERSLIFIRKTKSTNARYPRKAGTPLKKPL